MAGEPWLFDHAAYKAEVLEGIARVGATLCHYCTPNTDWPATTCDCKFGGPKPTGEQTGCPELRTAYRLLDATPDEDVARIWAAMVSGYA